MAIRDVRMNMSKVVTLLETRSAKEQKLDALLESMGGLDAVVKVGFPGVAVTVWC